MVEREDRINFTKPKLNKLRTPSDKRRVWHDTATRGLGLLVQPTGHKSFFWFRKVHGVPTWKTIGDFPDLTVEQARSSADQFNSDIAEWKRKDYAGPSPFKRRDGLTLETLFDKYLETYKTTGCSPNRGPATEKGLKDVTSWYDRYLKRWSNRKLDLIHRDHVRDLHEEITDKHGPIVANRVVSLLRRVINWAVALEMWAGDNAAEGIRLNVETERERYVEPLEMARLLTALRAEAGINWDLHDAVLLALYLGPRRSNLLAMRWSDIKMSVTGDAEWEIARTKNGKSQKIPLPAEALELIRERRLRVEKKDKGNRWVFPSNGKSGHLKDVKRSWTRLRKAVGISEAHTWQLHGWGECFAPRHRQGARS